MHILLQRRYGLGIWIVLFSLIFGMVSVVVRLVELRKIACNVDRGTGGCAGLVETLLRVRLVRTSALYPCRTLR